VELFCNYTVSAQSDPAEWARRREAEGWHGIATPDHFWIDGYVFSHLWVTLTCMACNTRTIKIASAFANNMFRSPIEFAQASLTLQHLSQGRFDAGLGAGWAEDEMLRAGRPFPPAGARLRMYREALGIVGALLRDGKAKFAGEFYEVDVPCLGPTPNTRPLLVGACGGPRAIREITPMLDRIEINGAARAHRGGRIDYTAMGTVSEDEVLRLIAHVREVNGAIPIGLFAPVAVGDGPEVRSMKQVMGSGFFSNLCGPAAQVADTLRGLEKLGVDRVHVSPYDPSSTESLAAALFA
jgi:alkanesulfonate monooxygenase SsuD/methylene tetrahydromethanopterin reductase-like flavin-dependent oxidoreductase (luciferase family)